MGKIESGKNKMLMDFVYALRDWAKRVYKRVSFEWKKWKTTYDLNEWDKMDWEVLFSKIAVIK